MHTFEIFGTYKDPCKPRVFTYPGAWEECTPEQLAHVSLITTAAEMDGDELEAEVRLRLLRILAGIPDKYFADPNGIKLEDLIGVRYDALNVDRAAFLPSLDWAFGDLIWEKSIVPKVSIQKVVRTEHRGRVREQLQTLQFDGPTDRLSRFSVMQWIFCDQLHDQFVVSRTPDGMHKLLAALYHPKGRRWSNESIEERAEDMARLDDATKLAAVMNFKGLRGWVARKYRRCFKGGDADLHGPTGMIVRLAGPKFGHVDKVPKRNIHKVFVYVEQCLNDAEELERKT